MTTHDWESCGIIHLKLRSRVVGAQLYLIGSLEFLGGVGEWGSRGGPARKSLLHEVNWGNSTLTSMPRLQGCPGGASSGAAVEQSSI